jgi:hypothetical protein
MGGLERQGHQVPGKDFCAYDPRVSAAGNCEMPNFPACWEDAAHQDSNEETLALLSVCGGECSPGACHLNHAPSPFAFSLFFR